MPKSQRRSWRRRDCERQPGRGSPGVAQDSQWQQHCGWSVVCAVCGAQENIQFVASFLFRLLSSCSACLLWLSSSCSPCLALGLAYVKEQLRRLLLPFVPCQFNWFVFYAKEDYTSSWRRLQLNLCGRPESRPVLSTPRAVPRGLSGCTCPVTLRLFDFCAPRCRSIHLPPAAQVNCLIRLCSSYSFVVWRCRRLSSVAKRYWAEAVRQLLR